jgi:hypothetical protein
MASAGYSSRPSLGLNMKFILSLCSLVLLVSCSPNNQKKQILFSQESTALYSETLENPLKGIRTISILPLYSLVSEKLKNESHEMIKQKLQDVGEIQWINLSKVPTSISGIRNADAALKIDFSEFPFIDTKKSLVTMASISLSASVRNINTESQSFIPIWSDELYFLNELDDQEAMTSMGILLDRLVKDLQLANPDHAKGFRFMVYQP